jgi:hypothetical protein
LEGAWLKIDVRFKRVTSKAEVERALSGGGRRDIRRAREYMDGVREVCSESCGTFFT